MHTDTQRSESSGRKRRIGGGPLVAVALIVLPVLYVLSIGPAFWLADHDKISISAYQTIYLPLGFLTTLSQTLERFIEVYLEWWAVLP